MPSHSDPAGTSHEERLLQSADQRLCHSRSEPTLAHDVAGFIDDGHERCDGAYEQAMARAFELRGVEDCTDLESPG